MTTKKLLIMGLGDAATEESVGSWLGRFGPVLRVDIIHDGNAADPVALVEMDIDDGIAAYLVSRLTNYWHEGKLLNGRLLNH